MFDSKRIISLENELESLRSKLLDLTVEVEVWTNLYIKMPSLVLYGYGNETKKVRVVKVVEDLLKTLGYEIKYEHTPEKEKYLLEKVRLPKKKKKKIKKEKKK